ncbi:MAG: hypothetical protein Q7S88_03835 [Candidatus Daviesbacteria bacterium]|nr:hypothetical protein [Candidatus Daviesbacteria bacterium]
MAETLRPGQGLSPDVQQRGRFFRPGRKIPEVPSTPASLALIQDTLRTQTSAQLPPELIEQFRLETLVWQRLTTPSNSPTFIGGVSGEGSIDQAVATVDVVVMGRGRAAVRFAAVGIDTQGSSRVMAAEYRIDHLMAYGVDVSVQQDEVPDDAIMDREKGTVSLGRTYMATIPTKLGYPFHTEGFITEAMAGQTSDHGSPHRYAIRFNDASGEGSNFENMQLHVLFTTLPEYTL